MNSNEIVNFIKQHPHCFLATVEGDQPHVRGIHLYLGEREELIMHTGKFKDLYQQIIRANKVELCFVDFEEFKQIRISCIAQEEDNMGLKKKIVAERQYLQPFVEQGGFEGLGIFRLRDLKAVVWTMESNMSPKEVITLN